MICLRKKGNVEELEIMEVHLKLYGVQELIGL